MRTYFVVALANLAAVPVTAQDSKAVKQPLFNGKNLDGWVVEGKRDFPNPKDKTKKLLVWRVEKNKILCAGKGYGFLRYAKKQFGDFHLHLEYRMLNTKGRNNSGIGIRTVAFDPKRSRQTRPSIAGYEIQLLNDVGRKPNKHSTGSLYRYVAPKINAIKPALQWNVMDIMCTGPRIRIRINNQDIIDFDQTTIARLKNKPLRGYICLQNHGSRIEFRNIWIQETKGKTR